MGREDYGESTEFFTSDQMAAMLGKHPVTLRKWRTKNKELGCIKYGPPYEYRGSAVVYPAVKFRVWCAQVRVIDGVPHINLPISAVVPLPVACGRHQQPTANEAVGGQ